MFTFPTNPYIFSGLRGVVDNIVKIIVLGLAKIQRAYHVGTTQHESGLSCEDMNTHEQTGSPG